MPNLDKGLVRSFNINNYSYDIIPTNFTTDGNGYITMMFNSNMCQDQCVNYLQELEKKTIKEFYSSKAGAATSFNLYYFPFNLNQGNIWVDEETGRLKLKVLITPEVLSNLQAHLALSISRVIKVKMNGKIMAIDCEKDGDIMGSGFESAELAQEFTDQFNTKVQKIKDFTPGRRYSASDCVRVKRNNIYVTRGIFNDASFVESYAEEDVWVTGRSFEESGAEDSGVVMLKNALIEFIRHATGINIRYCDRTSYVFPILPNDRKEYSIFVPGVEDGKVFRYLNAKEAAMINSVFRSSKFDFNILHDVSACIGDDLPITQAEKEQGIYAIDFYNKDVGICVLDSLFENSLVTQVGKNEYGLEVQRSPHLDMLRTKVTEMRKKEAQSHARAAQSHAEEAQSCANTTLSSTESAQLRAEAAKWYSEAAQLRAESTRLYAEASQLRKEIEAKEKKQNLSSCNSGNRFNWGSYRSGSSDDNDSHRNISSDLQGGQKGAIRSNPAGPSSSNNDLGGRKGQGLGGNIQDRAQGHCSTKLPYGTHQHYAVGRGYCGSSSNILGGLSSKTAANSARTDKLKKPDSKKCSPIFKWVKSFFSSSKKDTTLKHANSESGVFVNTPGQTPESTPKTVIKSLNGLPSGANTNITGVRTEQTANVAKESCVVS